jgi:hypothetical protein
MKKGIIFSRYWFKSVIRTRGQPSYVNLKIGPQGRPFICAPKVPTDKSSESQNLSLYATFITQYLGFHYK